MCLKKLLISIKSSAQLPRSTRCEKGVTLIELVIVMAIIAILASAIIPITKVSERRKMEFELKANLRVIRSAIDKYKKAYDDKRIDNVLGRSGYPESLNELVEGVEDIKDPDGKMIYFLRRVPRDKTNKNEFLAPEETWEIRSYENEPDDFSGGDDVYDVRSSNDGTTLAGRPYKDL